MANTLKLDLARHVIDLAFSMDIWIFGGYVRDISIRKQNVFGDLDLCCSKSRTHAMHFIRVLSTLYTVTRFQKKCVYRRPVYRCFVDDLLWIDLMVYDGTFDTWCTEETVDCTCNLFYMKRNVQYGIRYIPEEYTHEANPMATLVNMTREGVFERIWEPSVFDRASRVHDVCCRMKSLVKRDWTIRGDIMSPNMDLLITNEIYESPIRDACELIHTLSVRQIVRVCKPHVDKRIMERIVCFLKHH